MISYEKRATFIRQASVTVAFAALFLGAGVSSKAAVIFKNICSSKAITQKCDEGDKEEYIYIYDHIGQQTFRDFIEVATLIPLNKPFPKVYLNSRGGDADIARKISRILRLRNATVEERDMINPQNEPHCSSACVLVAAGAVVRNLAQIELHKGHLIKRIKGEKYEIKPMPNDAIQESKNFYAEMGIDSEIGRLIDNTTEENEWVYIKYDSSRPLKDQLIHRLGFLMNEEVAKDLAKLYGENTIDDWNAKLAIRKLAETGDKEAAYLLAYRFLHGIFDEPKDYAKALYWFRRAGELGNPSGYHMLGSLYANDRDIVPTDLEKSIRYYRKAAEMGYAGSQNNLAWAYYKGKGVKTNVPEAIYWATRAAEQGEPFAYSTLTQIRFDGNGFPDNDVETLKWAILAVDGLPDGDAKQELKQIRTILEERINEAGRREAKKLASKWKPLKEEGHTMRDKDDK